MKWLVFFASAALLVPLVATLALGGARWRGLLLAGLAFSPWLGDLVNINLVSMEDYRGPERGFEISLTDLIAWGLLLGVLARPGKIRLWLPGMAAFSVLFLLAVFGSLLAPEPLYAAFALWKACRLFVIFWVVANLVYQGVGLEATYRVWALIGCLSAVLVAKQKYVDGIYRVPLLFDHSNTVPLFLNLVMPALLLWSLVGRGVSLGDSVLGVAGALGMVGAVAMTYSRAGTALGAAAVALVFAVALFRRPSLRTGIGALVVSVIGLVGLAMASDSLLERIAKAPKASAEARDEFNVAAAAMARDHLLGVGVNQFSEVLSRQDRYRRFVDVMANEQEAGVAHHIYWLTAAELGFAGLGLFVFGLGRHWLLALRLGFRGLETADLLACGLAIGLAIVHVHGVLEWALRISPVSYQLALVSGLICGLAIRRRPRRRSGRRRLAAGRGTPSLITVGARL